MTIGTLATVDTIASFQAATSTTLPGSVVMLFGKSAIGDGGQGLWSIKGALTTNDGIVTVTDASGRKWQRMVEDQTLHAAWAGLGAAADYQPVINTLFNFGVSQYSGAGTAGGCTITLPGGLLTANSALNLTWPSGVAFHMKMRGVGPGATELYFPASNGLNYTFSSQYHTFDVEDFSLTSGSTTSAYTGLGVTQNLPENDAWPSSVVRMNIRGHHLNLSDGWNNAVVMWGVENVNYRDSNLYGRSNGTVGGVWGIGVVLSGNTSFSPLSDCYALIHNFVNVSFYNLDTPVYYGTYVQGVTMSGINVTNCNKGVVQPAGAVGGDQLAIDKSQFACWNSGILLSGELNNFKLTASNVYVEQPGTNGIVFDSTYTGVGVSIIGNTITGAGASGGSNGIATITGLTLKNSTIQGNQLSGLQGGIVLANGTQGVQGQNSTSSISPVTFPVVDTPGTNFVTAV